MNALEQINNANKNICKNIQIMSEKNDERGFFSENILNNIRNLLEGVFSFIYNKDNNLNLEYSWENYDTFLNYAKSIDKYNFLIKFHNSLQQTKSHYSQNEDIADRLMVRYLKDLYEMKSMLKKDFDLEILENISSFPLNNDPTVIDFYSKISKEIKFTITNPTVVTFNKYYVQKIKPFFVDDEIYYEITLTSSYDYASKFDRTIIYSKQYIDAKYCIEVSHSKSKIVFLDSTIDINILIDYSIAIRPCEFKHLSRIFGYQYTFRSSDSDYVFILDYLTRKKINLLDVCLFDEQRYSLFTKELNDSNITHKILNIISNARDILKNNKSGTNIIRYLFYNINNRIIKEQLADYRNDKLSGLYLEYGCKTFEDTPYSAGLLGHTPSLQDLFECIDSRGREDEIFARIIMASSKINNTIYFDENECNNINKPIELMNSYNNKLYHKHKSPLIIEKDRRIMHEYKNFYINQVEGTTFGIINELLKYSKEGIKNYKHNTLSQIENPNTFYFIDDEVKKNILCDLFDKSRVSVIYGPAGTGKTTLIKHFSNLYSNASKLFISQTKNALNHMKVEVNNSNSQFKTAAKIAKGNEIYCTDFVIVDESNTIDNMTMYKLMSKIHCKGILLVGDIYQIEAIEYGNWFNMLRYFLPKENISELVTPYRAENDKLKQIWELVRNYDKSCLDLIDIYGYSAKISSDVFNKTSEDEIILCLNYNGIFGINSINRYFQNRNINKEYYWDGKYYKINDPILFDDSKVYESIFFNNLKGRIIDIVQQKEEITFKLKIDKIINEFEINTLNVELLECDIPGKSIINLTIIKKKNQDDDDTYDNYYYVPFQVTYAISIHKAQGLEYDSVKIVITDEIEEQVTHSIFYTAITRAKKNLKIFWSSEIENKLFDNFEKKLLTKDAQILASKKKMQINKNSYISSFH